MKLYCEVVRNFFLFLAEESEVVLDFFFILPAGMVKSHPDLFFAGGHGEVT